MQRKQLRWKKCKVCWCKFKSVKIEKVLNEIKSSFDVLAFNEQSVCVCLNKSRFAYIKRSTGAFSWQLAKVSR